MPKTILLAGALLALVTPAIASAQEPSDSSHHAAPSDTLQRPIELRAITVTATRQAQGVFSTPAPVSVVDSQTIHEKPANNASDYFRDLPGVDVSGVGPNQVRPIIRGLGGQRILLLEDGLRLNNSRRQQNFGEIPALLDVNSLSRIEVVRGPASVLYGTDAIGGAVNLITPRPLVDQAGDAVHGLFGYRYTAQGGQQMPSGGLSGHLGRFGFIVGGSYRDAEAYRAPAGHFGGDTLHSDTPVNETGVRDQHYTAHLGYGLSEHGALFAKYERYQANDAGFGFVDPAAINDTSGVSIKIRYPSQLVNRASLGYLASGMRVFFADRVEVVGYLQSNQRHFDQDIGIAFTFPGAPPGSGVQIQTFNYTDLRTLGFRIELAKAVAGRHLLTYGLDGFRDRSNNTDSSAQTTVGFGPPQTQTSDTSSVPNAVFRSLGAFAQMDLALAPRLHAVLGTRVQNVHAETRPTPSISDPLVSNSDNTVVGTANVIYGLTRNLNLVATVGRGFRAPNLVERFFNGITPEGSGFESRTPDLKPETSVNVDFGVRYRLERLYLEAFVFQNNVHDGIRIQATGDTVDGFPEFKNVNVDRLRFRGLELNSDVVIGAGFSVGANYTHVRSKDLLNPSNPVGETFSDKLVAEARYRHSSGRFWLAYNIRHNGEQKDVALAPGPLGTVLPAFTVHNAYAGARVFQTGRFAHTVTLELANVTNRLYAEFPNASFFRPEPKRSMIASWQVEF